MSRTHALVGLAAVGLVTACSDTPVSPTAETPRLARAHFVEGRASVTGPESNGTLTVGFRIAGLGGSASLDVVLVADVTATYACMLSTGGFPGDPQTEVVGPVSAVGSVQFASANGGQVSASLTLSPPVPLQDCPAGQVPVLASIVYTNVGLSESGGQIPSIPLPGTFSRTYYQL